MIFDLETGTKSGFRHEGGSEYVAFSPDDALLAGAGDGVRVWNRHGVPAANYAGQTPIAFSKTGGLFASGNGDSTFTQRRVGPWTKLRTMDTGKELNALAFSPAASLLATGGGYNGGRSVRTLGVQVQALAFSGAGRLLAAVSNDHTIKLCRMPVQCPLLRP